MQRNLLNKDEILRLPSTKLLAILRGNKPLLLNKMMYKEHPLAKKLKDSPILEYNPRWTKNVPENESAKEIQKNTTTKELKQKAKVGWDTF